MNIAYLVKIIEVCGEYITVLQQELAAKNKQLEELTNGKLQD